MGSSLVMGLHGQDFKKEDLYSLHVLQTLEGILWKSRILLFLKCLGGKGP